MTVDKPENDVSSELLIARDVIDMAREYAQDYNAIEYLSNICFNMARIPGSTLDWDAIFSALDQAYYNKDHTLVARLEGIYLKITAQIESGS